MEYIIYIVLALLIIGVSVFAGVQIDRSLLKQTLDKQKDDTQKQINQLLKEAELKAESLKNQAKQEAENLKREQTIELKETQAKIKRDAENEEARRKQAFNNQENKLKQKEQQVQKQADQIKKRETELDTIKDSLMQQAETLTAKRDEVDKMKASQKDVLEKIAQLTTEQAKLQLIESIRVEAETKASSLTKDIIDEAKISAAKSAKKLIIETIQRTATEHAIENAVTVFHLENDEIKGKIIGREGRNIRALEAATGVEFIVDDTPEAILISGFDPIRREIARLSLQKLVMDGRIHPTRIEEIVQKTTKALDEEVIELGERTVLDLGIQGLHPELIKLVGRMRYRSSYGQNLLQHSREVAKMCATMAAELGLNVKLAKRAGLLHDIGKVISDHPETPHAILGMQFAQKYKEHPEVCNAIGAHHDEIEMTSLISPIIQACDAISGSRPGARREMLDSYIQRLKDLEHLAQAFEGVSKCYAIQAGRELRIIVDADAMNDDKATQLAHDVSQKIEKEMQYPGQVKITVIREKRAVAYAK